jgi:hypothetical protein
MSCTPPTVVIGGETLSTSDFQNAADLLNTVSGDGGDPTADGYDESVAGGNNTSGAHGVQFTGDKQTSSPPPITQQADASNDGKPTYKQGTPVTCLVWTGDYNMQLSPNFTVKSFSLKALYKNPLIDLPAYSITANQRCCNLQNLAMNIAEPLLAKFGTLNINSGIRNINTTPFGVSQHVSGQAIDVQFSGWSYARYWENAAWVKDNIPYDQFIFEHSDKTGLAWFHLSYNKTGNRLAADPTKVMTMYRNHYSPGLKRFG